MNNRSSEGMAGGAIMIAILAIGIGVVGWGSPQSFTDIEKVKSGSVSCTIPAGSSSCSQTVTFSPAYPVGITPKVLMSAKFTASQFRSWQVSIMTPNTVAVPWVAMPAAQTEFLGLTIHRKLLDLESIFDERLCVDVQVAGAAGSTLQLQYSTDTVTWNTFTPTIPIDVVQLACIAYGTASPLITQVTPWTAIYVRLVGAGGDGATTPEFGEIYFEWRRQLRVGGANPSVISRTGFTAVLFVGFLSTGQLVPSADWEAFCTNC